MADHKKPTKEELRANAESYVRTQIETMERSPDQRPIPPEKVEKLVDEIYGISARVHYR